MAGAKNGFFRLTVDIPVQLNDRLDSAAFFGKREKRDIVAQAITEYVEHETAKKKAGKQTVKRKSGV
jgi:predicted transcriptional regulator